MIEVTSIEIENNFLLSSIFKLTLDAVSKDPTHSIYLNSSDKVHSENFRLLSFASHSKVQMQLLSYITLTLL